MFGQVSVTFLKNGGQLPHLPANWYFPQVKRLKIRYSGSAIISCSSFSTLGAVPLGPVDLFGFILDSFFCYISWCNFISINSPSVRLVNVSGMLFVSFFVNTEEKKFY